MDKRVDILWVVEQVANSLRPFAAAKNVGLNVVKENVKITIRYLPQEFLIGLVSSIVRMIPDTTAGHSILIRATFYGSAEDSKIKIRLENSGLAGIGLATKSGEDKSSCPDLPGGGVCLEWVLPIDLHADGANEVSEALVGEYPFPLPKFYQEFRKHLQFHFSKPENLVGLLMRQNEKTAVFLQQVNECIYSNISDFRFDANRLSQLLSISRIQLYRKLKPVIKQSPANYIRSIRLQRAKQLLETTDLRVGEVAFQTGFESPSHFTSVFLRSFGVRPSFFSKRARNVTNE